MVPIFIYIIITNISYLFGSLKLGFDIKCKESIKMDI